MGNYRLVFVHGAGGNGSGWHFQTDYFADSLAVTLVGHNPGEEAGRNSIAEYADWLHEYLQVGLDERKVVLVGHSMGGAIALDYALRYGDELAGLGLIGTGARIKVAPAILNGLLSDYPATVEIITNYSFAPATPTEIRDTARDTMLAISPSVTQADFAACNDFNLMDKLSEIGPMPKFVAVGSLDKMTLPKFSEYLAANLSHSQIHIIEGVGHYLPLEAPDELNHLLADFLKINGLTD